MMIHTFGETGPDSHLRSFGASDGQAGPGPMLY